MTTAAKPTWAPARGGSMKGEGGLGNLSKQYSSRDLVAQTKLKLRQPGQGTVGEIGERDLKQDIAERERASATKAVVEKQNKLGVLGTLTAFSEDYGDKRLKITHNIDPNLDADDVDDAPAADNDSDEDDEDDEAELMRELQKIKRERAHDAAQKEAAKAAEDDRIRMEAVMRGNPLLDSRAVGDFSVKRRWDDDVVFKNCAKQVPEKKERTFVNDTLRTDFHRQFMSKYIL